MPRRKTYGAGLASELLRDECGCPHVLFNLLNARVISQVELISKEWNLFGNVLQRYICLHWWIISDREAGLCEHLSARLRSNHLHHCRCDPVGMELNEPEREHGAPVVS